MKKEKLAFEGKCKTKTEYVTDQIRKAILCGMFEPGQKLVLKVMAEKYDVSEQPVREAFKILQSEGLVISTPRSGTEVSRNDTADILEVYELRKILETYSVTRSIQAMDEEFIRQVNEELVLMKYYMENGDTANYSRINQEFHRLLHSKSSPMLQNMIYMCWQTTRSFFQKLPGRPAQSHEEHIRILEAIKAKDAGQLGKMMEQHLDQVIHAARQVLQAEEHTQ